MNRFGDIDWSSQRLPSVYGYYVEKLVSIEKALEPIVSQIDELPRFIKVAKRYCHFASEHGLSHDQSAALYIYTMEWGDMSLNRVLNKALRSQDRQALKIWFSYLRLFDSALNLLPTVKENIWRGVPFDIGKHFTKNQIITWWSVSSCSSSVNIIEEFLGNSENATFFLIEAVNGRKVSGYTDYEREDEVILRTGSQFRMKSDLLTHPNGSHVVHLIELDEFKNEVNLLTTMNDIHLSTTTLGEGSLENRFRSTYMPMTYDSVNLSSNYVRTALLALENRKLANQLKPIYTPMVCAYAKLPNNYYPSPIFSLNDNRLRNQRTKMYFNKPSNSSDSSTTPYDWNVSLESDTETKQSIASTCSDEVTFSPLHAPIPKIPPESTILFSRIYILKKTLCYYDLSDYEVGAEFEFISHVSNNSEMLCLKHLRTSAVINIDHSSVELDENTPLCLSKQGQGVIECFLLRSDARYSFLIHRSDQDENMYILSTNQHHVTKENLISHYFIHINKENNCFYLEHEGQLGHCYFSTFKQLVSDARVHQVIPLSKPVDHSLAMTEDELWKIDYDQLIVGNKIGIGEFGEIMSGQWKRNDSFESVDIAIKRLKLKKAVSKEFGKEICIMKRLRNKHLVSLFGISIDPVTNEKLMVYEFMIDGDLESWLKKQFILPSNDILVNYCHQICLGMSYLERNHCVHRDLACRNILLRGDQAKIADFGMAVIIDENPCHSVLRRKQSIKKLPYRWTAPEIFAGKTFTTRSDVWSFGICLVEIWSKGGLPFPSLRDFKEVRIRIQAGFVHEKPQQCPEIYYKIIRSCLITDPESRPSFEKLVHHFERLLIDKNEQNINKHVKRYKSIIPDYNVEEEEGASSIVNLPTPLSNRIDETNQKQYSLIAKEDQYRCTDGLSGELRFSPRILYDISECIKSTNSCSSDEEIQQQKLYKVIKPHVPIKPADFAGSHARRNYMKFSKTTSNNYRKVDYQKKTEE